MRRRFVGVLVVTVAAGAWSPVIPAAAATPGGMPAAGSGALHSGLGHYGTSLRSGRANRYGSGLRDGGYGHTSLPHDFGGHQGGWYQRGWGGTLNPGWGYQFGPNLGGFGH